MELDIPTLLAVEAFIAAVSAALILAAMPHGAAARGCLWWVAGGVTTGLGIGLVLVGQVRGWSVALPVANLVFALSPALYWTGARVFAGRSPHYAALSAGLAVMVIIQFLPPLRPALSWRMELSFGITALYLFAGALELLRSREALTARWLLIALFLVHGVLFVAGAREAISADEAPLQYALLGSWFGLVHFESILFSIGSAAFVIAFVRERGEARQRRVAEVDSLTGVSTRRAFLAYLNDVLDHGRDDDLPTSLVVFDLDHFKTINDTHGHAVGDRVLRLFCDTARVSLRRADRIGRLGGEEFALVLPGTSLAAAIEIAERVRTMYEAGARVVDGIEINGTASAGVAASSSDSSVQSLLIAADAGLYEAKARGRNRVERAPPRAGRPGPSPLRVA